MLIDLIRYVYYYYYYRTLEYKQTVNPLRMKLISGWCHWQCKLSYKVYIFVYYYIIFNFMLYFFKCLLAHH